MAETQIPSNYKRSVDWIIGAYETANVSFPNGFQKDAIQNAVGARKSNNWNSWHCDISLKRNEAGDFIVIEDSGTVGLTGENRDAAVVNEMMARGEELAASERLSRFTSMFNSGGNTTGGGLFGAGKSVYSVASKNYTYYFDSLREDGLYVANFNKAGQINNVAFENDEAKAFILSTTGLSEKTTVGTRVIIESPKDELIDSLNDGSIITFIQESWWLIISRLPSNSSITVNGVPVTVPENIKNTAHSYELSTPELYAQGYRVKHFGLYVFDDGSNIWEGISYYRKGMKIGEIEIKELPKKVEKKYWGYVEVDEEWEAALAKIEDNVHFGVKKLTKGTTTYQNLKNYCTNKIKAKLIDWGYIKDVENEDRRLKDMLKRIADNLQDLFDNLGIEDLGTGPRKSSFDVRWQNVTFPIVGSERVSLGDTISFSVRIRNSYATAKDFDYKLIVMNPGDGSLVSTIANERVKVQSNSVTTLDFNHVISCENSKQYAENRIKLVVKVAGTSNEVRREIAYFFDIDKPDNSREIVSLDLHSYTFPRENSRRINFGESLKDITYRIENKRNTHLSYRLNVSIHNASNPTCPKLVDVVSLSGSVEPFEEVISDKIGEIVFEQATYESHLTEGILELRARLIAAEDDDQFEKGDKITSYHFKIYLNSDEKNGKKNSFNPRSSKSPEDYRRSWCTPGNNREVVLNVGHVAYTRLTDEPERQEEYIQEQMLKQYVLLYLNEGKFSMFGGNISEMDPLDAVETVINKIESIYSESLR